MVQASVVRVCLHSLIFIILFLIKAPFKSYQIINRIERHQKSYDLNVRVNIIIN